MSEHRTPEERFRTWPEMRHGDISAAVVKDTVIVVNDVYMYRSEAEALRDWLNEVLARD
jgi:hypothetical protein